LRIPRTRKASAPKCCPRYRRRQAAVDQLIAKLFCAISTRQVSDVLQPMLGESYSARPSPTSTPN